MVTSILAAFPVSVREMTLQCKEGQDTMQRFDTADYDDFNFLSLRKNRGLLEFYNTLEVLHRRPVPEPGLQTEFDSESWLSLLLTCSKLRVY